MKIQIKLIDFNTDYSDEANFQIFDDEAALMMTVKLDFRTDSAETPMQHQVSHTVTIPGGMSHYTITRILFECSKMVDNFFNPEAQEVHDSLEIEI